MRKLVVAGSLVLVVVVAASAFGLRSGPGSARAERRRGLTPFQKRLLSGTASNFLERTAPDAARALGGQRLPRRLRSVPTIAKSYARNRGCNVNVNQVCENLTDPDLPDAGRRRARRRSRRTPRTAGH